MLFSPTIGAAIAAQYWYWFLWIRCWACQPVIHIYAKVLDTYAAPLASRSSSKFGPTILSIAFLRCLSNGAHVICMNFRRRIGKASKGWREAEEGGEPLAGEGKCP